MTSYKALHVNQKISVRNSLTDIFLIRMFHISEVIGIFQSKTLSLSDINFDQTEKERYKEKSIQSLEIL